MSNDHKVGDILVSVGMARGRMTSLSEQTIKAIAELNEVSWQTVTAAITQTNKAVTEDDAKPPVGGEVDEGPPLVEVGTPPKRRAKKKTRKKE